MADQYNVLASRKRMRILEVARSWLSVPYDHDHLDASWQETVPAAFDCATFICRVAAEALGDAASTFQANSAWLLDNLVVSESPIPGDVVGYERVRPEARDAAEHHLMLYAGSGRVIGACDIAGCVTIRSIDYEATLNERQWTLVEPPSFRVLELRRKSGPVPLGAVAKRKPK